MLLASPVIPHFKKILMVNKHIETCYLKKELQCHLDTGHWFCSAALLLGVFLLKSIVEKCFLTVTNELQNLKHLMPYVVQIMWNV